MKVAMTLPITIVPNYGKYRSLNYQESLRKVTVSEYKVTDLSVMHQNL